MEFHLTAASRARHDFNADLYAPATDGLRVDVRAVHELAWRRHQAAPHEGVRPGELYALALLDQIFCALIDRYRLTRQPSLFADALEALSVGKSAEQVDVLLTEFASCFVPLKVRSGELPIRDFLRLPLDPDRARAPREAILIQMLLVFADNRNPACSPLRGLFDDREIPAQDRYLSGISDLREFLKAQPETGIGGLSLFELIEAPATASPDSLYGQLEFIRASWIDYLPPELRLGLLSAQDLIREDTKRGASDIRPGKGDSPVPDFFTQFGGGPDKVMFGAQRRSLSALDAEPERFSPDTDWMPRAVVLAKSIYVWLDQLSKKYSRAITHLDQIPETEFELLARWGFNGLWLIGLWERSPASRRIKHMRGNPEAVASAYSLYDYVISEDLGGQAALAALRELANRHGIRLASDIVPNHMGIDSRWVTEHPDRFLQLDYPPYPAYRFTGPDLIEHPAFEIHIEDGYWNQSDAAVVFQLVDKRDRRARYLYHGNDGTSFPWNDTAQLNFLNPEAREAVVRMIVEIAREFPIMRLDAAMTLTKKHYQRLWFPEPGAGGSIPSRAEHGMTREQFDGLMPTEFWREVVDRVAAEAPHTLLIAEAFWLTEGFFVRTLGMHRVYNSAFMNMLKHEENANYRSVIRNTVEFDPRILQRYVNFMNNPDEDTAVQQFGKGDKYFGVATMMATLPGLPMFGHGQIEGFTEKYGHEYRRAYVHEQPDAELIRRHEREIFPLLRERDLFSDADNFALYDFRGPDGHVDENVFAYSNRSGERRALVIYHNKFADTAGRVLLSTARHRPPGSPPEAGRLITLRDGLDLPDDANVFYILRDRVRGLEYLYSSRELVHDGFYAELQAYECRVLMDFQEVRDDYEGRYAQLSRRLGGQGVASIRREFARLYLAPLLAAFDELMTPAHYQTVAESMTAAFDPEPSLSPAIRELVSRGVTRTGRDSDQDALHGEILQEFNQLHRWLAKRKTGPDSERSVPTAYEILFGAVCVRALIVASSSHRHPQGESPIDEWLLVDALIARFLRLNLDATRAVDAAELAAILAIHSSVLDPARQGRRFHGFAALLRDDVTRHYLRVNEYNGILWFDETRFLELIQITRLHALLDASGVPSLSPSHFHAAMLEIDTRRDELSDLAVLAEFQLGRLLQLLAYAGSARPRLKRDPVGFESA
ncbi:alpha-amylase [candidate division KSB1 bacterium]|nr:alpha-amylase [candidate division KSB1 bacterium]